MSSFSVQKRDPVVVQLVLDFGYCEVKSFNSSITELAECAAKNYRRHNSQLLTLAQEQTYKALRERGEIDKCMCITVKQSGIAGLSEGGTYHVLQNANELLMQIYRTSTGKSLLYPYRVDLVAHKAHVWRAKQQGWLFGLDLRAVEDLPTEFYPSATQWWCRDERLWKLREALGYFPLRLAGQI